MKQVSRHSRSPITLLAAVIGLLGTTQCGGSTTTPTATTAVSAVTISPASVIAAGSVTGTVTLSAPAPAGGATVSLTSSNTGVATVPATASIAAGSSSIGFIVVAVAAGSAVITASMGTSSMQSPALTVTARATLVSISLANSTVVGPSSVVATVTLSGAAPTGGAVVTLSATDPLSVPPTVAVAAGATSATFTVFTRGVSGTTSGTVNGSYSGTSASATLSVTPPTVATASFGVTGTTETETCTMMNGGAAINCTFNGSTSSAPAPIVAWEWSYTVGTQNLSQTTTGPVFTAPASSCSFLPPPPLPAAPANQWLPLTVTLRVRDNAGNVSAVVTDSGARLFPQGVCGF